MDFAILQEFIRRRGFVWDLRINGSSFDLIFYFSAHERFDQLDEDHDGNLTWYVNPKKNI
jgi:hypothetical protein